MRINNSLSCCNKTPSFNAWKRNVYTSSKVFDNGIKHRNDTFFFRGAIWDTFTEVLESMYSDVPKVNIYDYGCSDGAESLSIAMKLISSFGEEYSKKFFPIMAKDYDTVAINKAKSNEYLFEGYELADINKYTNNKFEQFFDINNRGFYKAKKFLVDNIEYNVANAISNCKKIRGDNNVVFARNFWPYLEIYDRYKFAENLHNNIGKNSLLIIGDFDNIIYDESIVKILTTSGFKSFAGLRNFYIKQKDTIPKLKSQL